MVRGLPEISFKANNKICESCVQEKQTKNSFRSISKNPSTKSLELIHMDLFGPTRLASLSEKKYGYILVDDFLRFTQVFFLTHKNKAFNEFQIFFKKIEQEVKYVISNIQFDHGGEFENNEFDQFCRLHEINHRYSSPRTPEQNGVVERRNRTLMEMA